MSLTVYNRRSPGDGGYPRLDVALLAYNQNDVCLCPILVNSDKLDRNSSICHKNNIEINIIFQIGFKPL